MQERMELQNQVVLAKRKKMNTLQLVILLLAAVALTNCTFTPTNAPEPTGEPPTQIPQPVSTPTGTPGTTGQPMQPSTPVPTLGVQGSKVDTARQDLARRLSIQPEALNLVENRPVTWPDSSLGCPQPDMMYAQVLTPGFLLIFKAGDALYEYHAGRDGDFTYCEHPQKPLPGVD